MNNLSQSSKRDINLSNIAKELNLLIDLIKKDSKLVNQLSKENKIIVFEAIDTGNTVTIELKKRDISVYIGEPKKYNIKFIAQEVILFGMLSGEIDPEGAFFSRKIKIEGSTMLAVRFKNMYLNRIQYYFSQAINAA